MIRIETTRPEHIPGIIELCRNTYVGSPPWSEEQLLSHQQLFPEGQFVAIHEGEGTVVGMAASLIVLWDDYEMTGTWRDFTASGYFTNHDPEHGRTLYGAEVMVDPGHRGKGIGKLLYRERRDLTKNLQLKRIRAGSRLRGYHRFHEVMSPQEYLAAVIAEEIVDPTLTFQLHQGFEVLQLAQNYLRHDPESLGYAAVIEWRNPDVPPPGGLAPQLVS
jgi:GNAT superfamily N-acetyltransferase